MLFIRSLLKYTFVFQFGEEATFLKDFNTCRKDYLFHNCMTGECLTQISPYFGETIGQLFCLAIFALVVDVLLLCRCCLPLKPEHHGGSDDDVYDHVDDDHE